MRSIVRDQAKVLEAQIALALARSRAPASSTSTLLPLFVDPQNVSGTASNGNSGQLPGSAILTTAEYNRRVRLVTAEVTSPTTTLYLSEDLQALGPSPVGIDVANLQIRSPYTIQMTPVSVKGPGGVLNAGTVAINPAAPGGGQRQTVHAADIANWAPYVMGTHGLGGAASIPVRVLDSTTGASSWIASGAGGATATVTRPVDGGVTSSPPMSAGHGYTLERPGALYLASTPGPAVDGQGLLTFVDCAFAVGSTGPLLPTSFALPLMTTRHCAFLGAMLVGGQVDDCALCDGVQGNYLATLTAGLGLFDLGSDQLSGVLNIGGDTLFTGDASIGVGGGSIGAIFVFSGALGVAGVTGLQVQDISGGLAGIQIDVGAVAALGGLCWGNGNTGSGIRFFGKSSATYGVVPSVTGAGGDFDFAHKHAFITHARAWNDAVGAYTEAGGPATRLCSWANLSATIAGGGFADGCHELTTGSSIVIDN